MVEAIKSKVAPDKNPYPKARQLIDFYNTLKGQRSNFESYWQSLHDYFYIEAANVNRQYFAGSEVDATYLWDSTTVEAADVLASGFMNYLTPPTSKWFKLSARDPILRDNKKVGYYLEAVEDEVYYTLNRSNFYDQLISSYKSSGVYGTAALMEEEDIQDDARFYNLPIKQICLVEDVRGRICEYFIEFEYTAEQAAQRWGTEKLSTAMKAEINPERRQNKKHPFLLHIAKRSRRDIRKSDKENLPIAAEWIDVDQKSIIDEGGYNEFPAMTHRFDKRPFIQWGFSPAMKALPFARILNAIAKTNLRAMMKHTDPPVAVPNNAFLLPFNANPRAVNYYRKNKMVGGAKDIFAFGNFGNPEVGLNALEYYSNQVKSIMYYDVFLAFENLTKQMNNPEVMERINEKMTLLGPAVGRYISEVLNPIVIRTIGILSRRGKLPPPPDELLDNPEYEIDCISQLAQVQRRSELNSLVSGLTLVGQMAQFDPTVLDKISSDRAVDQAWQILGGPISVLRDDEEISAMRDARAAAAQQQAQMNQVQQGAEIVKTGSEIDANVARAEKEINR